MKEGVRLNGGNVWLAIGLRFFEGVARFFLRHFNAIRLDGAVWAVVAGVVLSLFGGGVFAAGQEDGRGGGVKSELRQFLVSQEGGKEVLKKIIAVKPGNVIEYRLTYTNQGPEPVRDVVLELPLSDALEYVPQSVQPSSRARFAAAERHFLPEPLLRGDGGLVSYDKYRFVRWLVPLLLPGGRGEVSVRARVIEADGAAGVQVREIAR